MKKPCHVNEIDNKKDIATSLPHGLSLRNKTYIILLYIFNYTAEKLARIMGRKEMYQKLQTTTRQLL